MARVAHPRVEVEVRRHLVAVDVTHVVRAVSVPRHVDLARTQREPAHHGRRAAPDTDRHAHPGAAHPRHERGGIHGPSHVGARHPAPHVAARNPAAVVERREAPGGVVHPGPAPRADPHPVPDAVRRPARGHVARDPQGAVLGVLFPAAVAVQVLDAGHLGRHIAGRDAAVFPVVACRHPVVEVVTARFGEFELRAAVLPEAVALAGLHRHAGVLHLQLQLARLHGGVGGVVVPREPVAAGPFGREPAFGGHQQEVLRRLARAQPRGHVAVVQAHGEMVVVECGDLEFGVPADAQDARADAHLGTAAAGRREPVAGGDRAVARGLHPLALFVVVDPDLALDLGQPADAARRVGLRGGVLRTHGPCRERTEQQQAQPEEGRAERGKSHRVHQVPAAVGGIRDGRVPDQRAPRCRG